MRRFSPFLICSLSCALLPFAASAADAKWVHATSAHFDLYAAQSESDAKAALLHLETVRAQFSGATHSPDPNNQPVRIVSFQSSGDFNKYKPSEFVGTVTAYSLDGSPATIVALGLKPENYEKIFMEYCQLVLDHSAPKVPYWFRAGLAQFYSTLKPADATIKMGAPPTRSFHTKGGLDTDLTLLFTIDRVGYLESRGKAANDFYSDTSTNAALGAAAAAATSRLNAVQSNISQDFEVPAWTLTHMLMFSQDYRAKTGEFIGALNSGQETGAALIAAYGRSTAQVNVDLKLYMKQPSYVAASMPYKYEKPAPAQTKAATKEEVDTIIAALAKK